MSEGIHRLVGILSQPSAGVAARGEVVVLVHGGMANKNSFYHKHLASKLASEAFHVFRFDFVGNVAQACGRAKDDPLGTWENQKRRLRLTACATPSI